MKTHYAEENTDAASCNDTADEHCWREHQVKRSNLFGDLAVLAIATVLLSLSFLAAAWNALPTSKDEVALQSRQPMPVFTSKAAMTQLRRYEPEDDR